MKWQPVSISLMAVTLLVVVASLVQQLIPLSQPSVFEPRYKGDGLQLGYYDLLSKNRELYNTEFDTREKVVMMTLSSPNDNRFMVKVRMEQQKSTEQGTHFSYKPVYISNPNDERMITNILGYMSRNGVLFDSFSFRGEHIIVTPSGQIITYQ